LFSRTVRIDSTISWSSSTRRMVRCWGGILWIPWGSGAQRTCWQLTKFRS